MAINRETHRILRSLVTTIGEEADSVTRSLAKSWTRSWDELHGAWQVGLQDATERAMQSGSWPNAWELARLDRLQAALGASQDALTQLGKRAGIEITDGVGSVVSSTVDVEPRLIASTLPAGEQASAATEFAANVLPNALDLMVSRTQSDIVSLTKQLSPDAMEAMHRELIKGVALGDNPRTVARAMVDRVQGSFEGGLTRAVNIARTEMLDSYRAASMHTHAANSDVLSGWVWQATLDSRTCLSCWSMNGSVHPLTQPGPWDHQQGRCARLPKTKSWADLGIVGVDEPADLLPDAASKFWGLPEAQRQAIMGPRRLELLRSGRIGFDDLAQQRAAAGWRPSFAPRAVQDLERLAARRKVAGVTPTPHTLAPKAPTPSVRRPAQPAPIRPAPDTPTPVSPALKVARPAPVEPAPAPAQPMTSVEFDARIRKAKAGDSAADATPIKADINAAGSDPSTWKVTGFTGLDKSVPGATAAGTKYIRSPWFVNDRLRFPEGRPLKSWEPVPDPATKAKLAAQADRQIAALDRLMDQSPLPSDVVVWRGVRLADLSDVPTGNASGYTWLDRGFVSTTSQREIAEHSFSGSGGALLRILTPEGTPALGLAGLGESEVLLARGLRFRVVADRGLLPNGARLFDVEVVPAKIATKVVPAVTDPALKMTVAQLKAIARDNNVPLTILGTRKADMVKNLRDWEQTYVVKLRGLPEFKPPRVAPVIPDIKAPPLGVPSATAPQLTGASLNDWSDHFVHDLAQGRLKFVNKAGDTVPEGVRVTDLRIIIGSSNHSGYTVATGTAWRLNGVSYLIEHGPDDFGAPWVSRALTELRAAHEAIPAAKAANKSYTLLSGRNSADVYWAKRYNKPTFESAASAGRGHINVYGFNPRYSRVEHQMETLRHETGHNLESLADVHDRSYGTAWAKAADADAVTAAKVADLRWTEARAVGGAKVEPGRDWPKGVTDYGRSSHTEDYAESVMLYQLGPIATGKMAGETAERVLYFRDLYPRRAALLDKLMPEVAKAQKAEIAALRAAASGDLSKLKVADLRALAKTRGITVPSGTKKADIVSLLKGEKPVAKAVKKAVAPAAGDLSKMTVPQLKALAKERGVKLASTDRKADIIAKLERPGKVTPPSPKPRASTPVGSRTAADGTINQTVTVRPSLAAAPDVKTVNAVVRAEAKALSAGSRFEGINLAGHDLQTAREHAEGILQALERFPRIRVSIDRYTHGAGVYGAYGETTGWAVRFNTAFARTAGRNEYLSALRADLRNGWHPAGCGTPAAVALHEFGHAVDYFFTSYKVTPTGAIPVSTLQDAVSALVTRMADKAGMAVEDYIRAQLGGYALKHRSEMFAEAFSDAMVNGDDASELSKGIFRLVTDRYRQFEELSPL